MYLTWSGPFKMSPSNLPPPRHGAPHQPTPSASGPPPALGKRRKTPSELRQEQLSRAVQSRNSRREAFGASEASRSGSDSKSNGSHSANSENDLRRAASIDTGDKSTVPSMRLFRQSFLGSEEPGPLRDDRNSETISKPSVFRDVTQISSRTKGDAPAVAINMKDALKVLAPASKQSFSSTTQGRPVIVEDSHPFSESSESPPVDFSLKVSVRFISVDSLFWCHRLTPTATGDGLKHFVQRSRSNDEDLSSEPTTSTERIQDRIQDRFGKEFYQSLHSWVHPSPDYVELYELASAGASNDSRKLETVGRLHRKWEEAFRSLYYMFCQKHCNLFYLCTKTFLVMFERENSNDDNEDKSQAYWSRSTRGLRKALQEHGVEFVMPLSKFVDEAASFEDIRDLTELEKINPGRTRLVYPKSPVDNNLESILAFRGGSVHRLFDFLLNYRHLIAYSSGADFPTLYSPVEFSKACLYSPEIKCKRTQCSAENSVKEAALLNSNGVTEAIRNSPDILYTLELKGPPGSFITPWVVNGICAVFQKSQKLGFEVIIEADPMSKAFNIVKERWLSTGETRIGVEASEDKSNSSVMPRSKVAVVKHIRYSNRHFYSTMAPVS